MVGTLVENVKPILLHYRLYGLSVASEIPLPLASVPAAEASAPDWEIRLSTCAPSRTLGQAPAVEYRTPGGSVMTAIHEEWDGTWLDDPGLAAFRICFPSRCVEVFPLPEAEQGMLGLVLAGQVLVYLLLRSAQPVLHASAVETGGGVAVFLGPKGQGKTTMAAQMLRRGARLVTDDSLPLRMSESGIYGVPSLPLMKLWPGTVAHALNRGDDLPRLAPDYDKRVLRLDGCYGFAEQPLRIHRIYLLNRYSPDHEGQDVVFARELSPRESFVTLVEHTSWRRLLSSVDAANLMPFYAQMAGSLAVRVLNFPDGFDRGGEVYDHIMRDLEEA